MYQSSFTPLVYSGESTDTQTIHSLVHQIAYRLLETKGFQQPPTTMPTIIEDGDCSGPMDPILIQIIPVPIPTMDQIQKKNEAFKLAIQLQQLYQSLNDRIEPVLFI